MGLGGGAGGGTGVGGCSGCWGGAASCGAGSPGFVIEAMNLRSADLGKAVDWIWGMAVGCPGCCGLFWFGLVGFI